MEELRNRCREVNDQVKNSYINRYEIENGVSLLKLTNGKYKELPYSTEVTLEKVISYVDKK